MAIDTASGFRTTCFTANHKWGECTCKTEVSEDKGFVWQGVLIVDPTVSDCGRYFVEPTIFYGQTYKEWKNASK